MRNLFSIVFVVAVALSVGGDALAAERPNVLMIWVDDLRPEFTAYGTQGMQTPNLDRLAARSVRFDRAYCNIPVCGASRASVMTSVRGTPKRYTGYLARAAKEAPDATPLHATFRRSGYHTAGFGKILHNTDDHRDAWDEIDDFYEWPGYRSEVNKQLYAERQRIGKHSNGVPWEVADADDADLADGKIAAAASEAIKRLASADKPFFIATGFYKPHLPFVAPAEYWRPYPVDQMRVPDNFLTECNVPGYAFSSWGELRGYYGMPRRGTVSRTDARRLIAGYRACVSFTDANVGRLLDALDATGKADNTIVLLLGDHGWNLGEHGMWCKHCCFETSMRTALLCSAPMLKGFAAGRSTAALTEFIDLYPTLCELAGVPTPDSATGRSFAPLLTNPSAEHRDAAIGRYGPGDTLRTDRYRYTLFRNRTGEPAGQMLFDHATDPHENHNLADEPEFASVVDELRERLVTSFED